MTYGLKKINSTGLLSSNQRTGSSSLPGEDLTGLILRSKAARTGTWLTGSIGLSANSNSGTLMLTALLMASNTGNPKTKKSGFNGSNLKTGPALTGRNSIGLTWRTLTSVNGNLKTGRDGLHASKLMLTKNKRSKNLSLRSNTLKMTLLVNLKRMNGSLRKTKTGSLTTKKWTVSGNISLSLRFPMVSICGSQKTKITSLKTLMQLNGKVTIGKISTGRLLMAKTTASGMSKSGRSGPRSSKRRSTRCTMKRNVLMSHGALKSGLRLISSLGRLGLTLRTGKLMTGTTSTGLTLRTMKPGAGMMLLGLSGLILNRASMTEYVTVFLKVGNTGMRKISVSGSTSSTLRTGKVMTGRSSIGLISRTMMMKILMTGLMVTGWNGLTGSKILSMSKATIARISTTRSITRISCKSSRTGSLTGSRVSGTLITIRTWTGNLTMTLKIGRTNPMTLKRRISSTKRISLMLNGQKNTLMNGVTRTSENRDMVEEEKEIMREEETTRERVVMAVICHLESATVATILLEDPTRKPRTSCLDASFLSSMLFSSCRQLKLKLTILRKSKHMT